MSRLVVDQIQDVDKTNLVEVNTLGQYINNPETIPVQASGSDTERTLGDRFAEVINVKDFGAVGDDSTDNYASWQAAFDYAGQLANDTYSAVAIAVPSGTYRFSQKAVCRTGFSDQGSVGNPGVFMIGAGSGATLLVANPENTTGCVEFTSDGNSEVWGVSRMGFLSDLDADAATNNGNALEINSTLTRYTDGAATPGWGAQGRRSVELHDLYFGGYGTSVGDRNSRGNFDKCIYLDSKWYPHMDNIYIRGGDRIFDGDTNAQEYVPTGRTFAIHTRDCYSPELGNTYVSGHFTNGVRFQGRTDRPAGITNQNDNEDFRLHDCFLVGQDIGFAIYHSDDQVARTLYEPGGSIVNCHINSDTAGIHIRYHRQVVISNSYFYVPNGRGYPDYTGNPASIWVEGGSEILITSCEFLETGLYVDNDNASCGVKVDGVCYVNVTDCQFNMGGIGVKTMTGSSGRVNLHSCFYNGARTGDWDDFVKYADDAQIMTVFYRDNDKSGSRMLTRMEASYSGSGATLQEEFAALRSDYSTNASPILNTSTVRGLTTTGEEKLASQFRTDWSDNTEGSETADLLFFLRRNGSNNQVMSITGSNGKLNVGAGFSTSGQDGVSGSFTTTDGKTITVTNGIVTNIA